jgi:hypothetical protein
MILQNDGRDSSARFQDDIVEPVMKPMLEFLWQMGSYLSMNLEFLRQSRQSGTSGGPAPVNQEDGLYDQRRLCSGELRRWAIKDQRRGRARLCSSD